MNFSNDHPGARRAMPRLQFTSMIDVIFLLLIFFMTTTTLAEPESELSSKLLANQKGGSAADLTPQVVEVTILNRRPVYRVGERLAADKASLVAILRTLPREAGVYVQVDDAVPTGFAAAALQATQDAGFRTVGYVPEGE